MSMYGADVGQLRALCDRLEMVASDLERTGKVLSQDITTTTQWQGPDAGGFRGDWSGTHYPRITAAAAALRTAARAVRANADQQEGASAVDGSSAGNMGGGGSAPTASRPSTDGVRPVGFREMLDEPFLGVTGGVPLTWGQVIGFIPNVGTLASGIVLGENLADRSLSGGEKAYLATETGLEAVAGGLRGSGNPVAYGFGVAASQWLDVADAARKADFSSSGVAMVFNEVARDPWGSAVAASEAVVGSLGDIVDNFIPW